VRIGAGTVAVVTGAAGGIGRGLALELARRGAPLALVDVDAAGLARTRALAAAHGVRVSTHATDVADRAAMAALPDAVVAEHGAVHLLVNNAGVSVAAPVAELDLDDLAWLLGVNLWGVVHGCRFFLPHLARAPRAHVCNVLSDFALLGFPTKSPYCAAKFAVRGFSEALRAELAGSSVGLTCVYPGPVATDLVRRGRAWDAAKQAAEAEFVASRAIPVAKVARRTLAGIERGRARVLIGAETRAIDLATRLAPGLVNTLVGRLRGRVPFV
jgi:short-subunit dehydrogenase